MKLWHCLLVLSLFLENALAPQSAISQTEETETSETTEEIPPDFGTVPGIYYDPEVGRSPSLEQMEGSSESGAISIGEEDYPYNVDRAWQRGSTPDEIVKVGDLENDPQLEGIIEIEELTLREIAANGGVEIESAPLKSIGLINSMTLNEFLLMFPEYQNRPIEQVPIIIESIFRIESIIDNASQIQLKQIISEGQRELIERLSQEEALKDVPLEAILNGEYDEVVDWGTKEAITVIVEEYPELGELPVESVAPIVNDIVAGDWDGVKERIISEGQRELIERLSQEEALKDVPLEAILNGEYDEVVDWGTKEAIAVIVEEYPELGELPLEGVAPIVNDIVAGDWEGATERVLEEAEKELIERLANEPMFENIPVEAIISGDWGAVVTEAEQALLAEVLARFPELENAPINRLFPMVGGIISGDWSSVVNEAKEIAIQEGSQIITRELLKMLPELGDAPLGALPIDRLLVGDIEGLADAALDRVPYIANRYLSELGNLSQTPGTMLAIDTAMILLTGDIFGRLDIPFAGDVETPINYVLSGGTRNQVFLPEPCLERSCKHFEVVEVLSGMGNLINGWGNVQGKAWVEGSSQDVPGGKGFLRWVNAGKERTGVPVWSTDAHVKLSLEDIDEGGNGEPATARIWLNFQVCVYPPFLGEHCTPHIFSFATPWKVREGGVMVVFSRTSPSDWVEYGRDRASDTRNSTSEPNRDRSGN